MIQVNIGEAKARLSDLVGRALSGEEVIIARDNTPVLRLVPIASEAGPRAPGSARGQVHLSADFDEPIADLEAYSK